MSGPPRTPCLRVPEMTNRVTSRLLVPSSFRLCRSFRSAFRDPLAPFLVPCTFTLFLFVNLFSGCLFMEIDRRTMPVSFFSKMYRDSHPFWFPSRSLFFLFLNLFFRLPLFMEIDRRTSASIPFSQRCTATVLFGISFRASVFGETNLRDQSFS